MLDDLHWADSASVGLLFRLGRRLEAHRVMVLGTYRPDEVPKGISDDQRNPLAKVLAEFRRYLGDIWIDLDRVSEETGREFIDAYLDSMPNRLDQAFREALYEHTHGEPLFTVELVSELGDRGDLVQSEDGYWELGATLTWDEMPPRVEGVVAERIARLPDEVRDYLKVGSAEGDQFTAESVAQVRGVDVRTLIRQISGEAQNTHHLVQAAGVERVAGRGFPTIASPPKAYAPTLRRFWTKSSVPICTKMWDLRWKRSMEKSPKGLPWSWLVISSWRICRGKLATICA